MKTVLVHEHKNVWNISAYINNIRFILVLHQMYFISLEDEVLSYAIGITAFLWSIQPSC